MIILSFLLISPGSYSQDLRLMFYNAENVFDTVDDPQTEDDEFLPSGVRRWNPTRYLNKLTSIYKTIAAAGEWSPPSIVAFCEIENRKVLSDLTTKTYLSKYSYSIIHEDSPDRRGIDVCLIYLADQLKSDYFEYWIPESVKPDTFSTRSVLYARFLYGTDTIHLIVNHWPSRRGGVLAGEDMRISIASMVSEKADSILRSSRNNARIIITGDFNCTPEDTEIRRIAGSGAFVNLTITAGSKSRGTYRYQGTWETIDQIIVSKALMERKGLRVKPGSFRIFDPDFLLMNDPAYPGQSPYSTYRGYRYQGGFSDHLPVMVDLYRDQ